MLKIIFSFAAILTLFIFIFVNLGKWLDVTKIPVKSDLVVCFGGGTIDRVKKSIELLEDGYATKFLLLGESWYNQPYLKKNYPNLAVEIDESPKNTADEIRFVKEYMAKHHYKSALIVTDPPHSRRVQILTSLISVDNDETFSYVLVSSDVTWWDQSKYYQNKKAFRFVRNEMLRIPYIYVYYGLLEKIGFKWSDSEYLALKKRFGELVNGELFRSDD